MGTTTSSAPPEITLGRAPVVAAIQDHAAQAAEGTPQFILIEGAPGTGKTHLIRHLLQSADPSFDQLCLTLAEEDSKRPDFVRNFLLGTHLEMVPDSTEALIRAGHNTLRNLRKPTVIVLEDFHWADTISAEATWRMLREFDGYPGLVVITMRPSTRPELNRLRDLARAHPHATYFHLENLSLQETRELTEAISAFPISDTVARRIHHETGGLPALVAEVAQWLQRTTPYPGRSIEHALAALRQSLRAPHHPVSEPILALISDLPPTAREVLELLAIADKTPATSQLQELLGEDMTPLQHLVKQGIVEHEEYSYGFGIRYQSWRSTVLSTLDPHRRAQLHATMAASGTEQAAFQHLFRHAQLQCRRTFDHSHLCEQGIQLAASLENRGELDAAFDVLHKVVQLSADQPQLGAHIRFALKTGSISRLGALDLQETYRGLPAGPTRMALLALTSLTRGNLHEALSQLAVVSCDDLDEWDEVLFFCHVTAECCRYYLSHGGYSSPESILDIASLALEQFTTRPSPADHSDFTVAETRELVASWRALCTGTPLAQPPALSPANSALHVALASRKRIAGEFQESYAALNPMLQPCANTRHEATNLAKLESALLLFYAGRWDEAQTKARAAAERGLEVGESPDALLTYVAFSLVPSARGDARANRLLERVSAAETMCSPAVREAAQHTEAWAYLSRGDSNLLDTLMRALRLGTVDWPTVGLLPVVMFARTVAHGQRLDMLPLLIEIAQCQRIPASDAVRRYVNTYICSLREENPARRIEVQLQAVKALDEVSPIIPHERPEHGGLVIQRALHGLDIGELAACHPREFGVPEESVVELVLWAADIFVSCGADSLAERARTTLARLQAQGILDDLEGDQPAQTPDVQDLSLLTRREREVTAMVGKGLTNRNISEELVISVRTVETHVRNILAKLEISTRRELHRYLTKLQSAPPNRSESGSARRP